MGTIKSAIIQYKTLNRTLPPSLEALVTPPSNARVKRKLIEDHGIVDPWGTKYQYRIPGKKNGGPYEIYSLGEDKKESDDDVYSN